MKIIKQWHSPYPNSDCVSGIQYITSNQKSFRSFQLALCAQRRELAVAAESCVIQR